MKEGIHPEYTEAEIECACGNVVKTKSTRGSFKVDICSNCHPYYTGKQKLLDSAGRVDKFRKKYGRETPGLAAAAAKAPAPAPASAPEGKASGNGEGSASQES